MRDQDERIILVDADDCEIGIADKLSAHRQGAMHRAISVCVVDPQRRMLLQRRAPDKYHSGGLWTNACCTHPRPGERPDHAAERRLYEELGVACRLKFLGKVHYRADVGAGLIEDEIVHLFFGAYSGAVSPDASEVDAFAWRTRADILADIERRPDRYTYWFKHYVRSLEEVIFEGAGDRVTAA